MSAQISFNPVLTTNAAGTFNVSSLGYIQGTAQNDPAIRNQLAGGVLANSETLPMWGGVAISENVPGSPTYNSALGGSLVRATQVYNSGTFASYNTTLGSSADITGFSVFDQNSSMTTTPQSPVPLAGSSMGVNFYRLGSGARIAVACDPSLVGLDGQIITSGTSWDFTAQRLIPYVAAYAAATPSGVAYTSATGAFVLTFAAAPLSATDANNIGKDIALAGYNLSAFNGSFTIAASASSGTVLTVYTTPGLGAVTPTGGGLLAGGGYLPVRVLDVQIGNSMTVSYDATTGFATWNRNGSTAIILI